ncbi:MAG: hypothetical protein GW858_01890 [Sphingomonadales bacterium]|nr:hypothetical protein [Sphingomonadales bacterium]NCQ22547.1 hypothetical protein [Sphingomonadales bacterium]NCT05091.1 hypothetical protein [Sphingomonadales bacterium]
MTAFEFIWLAAYAGGFIALLTILIAKREVGSTAIAAILCAVFGAFTAVQIVQDGVIGFFINHTQDLTGLQVWWDLLMCALIALFFIAPRARKQGMNVTLWGLFVGTTASIGLLAMCARLFWLERQASARAA